MEPLVVGQKLWYVPSRKPSAAEEVTIMKVGRKWLTVNEGWKAMRVSKRDLAVDGGGHTFSGYCHVSREKYERKVALAERWRSFISTVGRIYSVPDDMTAEKMDQLEELLVIKKAGTE